MNELLRFVPDQVSDELHSEAGIELVDTIEILVAEQRRALGGYAGSMGMLRTSIRCLLVGFDDDAFRLLAKAETFLRRAIAIGEVPRGYIPHGNEAARAAEIALVCWLLRGENDQEAYRLAIEEYELYFDSLKIDAYDLSLTLPEYIDAGRYDLAIERFESHPKMKPPAAPARAKTPGQMAYVLAKHHLTSEHSDDEIAAALTKYLDHAVPDGLNNGDYSGVARWMKIAYWNDASTRPHPKEALLRAYDFLPFYPPTTPARSSSTVSDP